MKLNSRTGTHSSPVSSIHCNRPLHTGTRALQCNVVGRQLLIDRLIFIEHITNVNALIAANTTK